MIVLSLFDGISCGRVAFERAKIEIDKYYAQKDVCMPILGSGVTRIDGVSITQQELLDIIVLENLTILKIEITYNHADYDISYDNYNTIIKDITTLDDLDFDYDAGYGTQEIFGVVYCKDSNNHPVWLTRGEYDGKEWWKINTIPDFYNSIN